MGTPAYVEYRGDCRPELRGLKGWLTVEGEYLFFRRENLTLIKEHVSRISYKRLQLRKRFFGGGGELRLPKQEIGPSGWLEEVCNHKFKGSAGEPRNTRKRS